MSEDLEWWFVDFETFYSTEYSLARLDNPSYILDPRFEAICLGVYKGLEGEGEIIDGPDIPRFLSSLPPRVAMGSHNALFDMSILSWRYNYVPTLIVDTLSMARTLLRHKLRRMGLGAIAEFFGLKKGDYLANVKGMSRADIIANGMWPGFTEYCLHDAWLCREIFKRLIPELPHEELILQDIVARTAVQPALRLDMDVLATNLTTVQYDKQILFMKAMFAGLRDKGQLMSNPQFAELLKSLDVDPPMTVSKTTGLRTFSFSKSNPEFLQLLDHDDARVSTLVEARLSFKTTIEETRTERMLNIGRLEFPHHGGTGVMPIPLIVGAAHTHRLGGGWRLNPQNWKRGGRIRQSIKAPPGFKIVTVDKRQIEARMNAWFCGEEELVEQFRRDLDVYSLFASDIYGYHVDKVLHPIPRFVGKTSILQLGYQAWWPRFQASVWLQSYDGINDPVTLSDDEAREIVTKYRKKYWRIANMWKWLPQRFGALAGVEPPFEHGPIRFEKGKVVGPSGLCLYYENLRFDGEWWFDFGGGAHKLYGGKFLENIIQFLSRVDTMQGAVRLKKPLDTYSTRMVHSSHDELVYLVPEQHVEPVKALVKLEMTRVPTWATGLPLAVDIGVGDTYGEAK
jgi:DNA polymerase